LCILLSLELGLLFGQILSQVVGVCLGRSLSGGSSRLIRCNGILKGSVGLRSTCREF
jgi:hypothetical protein